MRVCAGATVEGGSGVSNRPQARDAASSNNAICNVHDPGFAVIGRCPAGKPLPPVIPTKGESIRLSDIPPPSLAPSCSSPLIRTFPSWFRRSREACPRENGEWERRVQRALRFGPSPAPPDTRLNHYIIRVSNSIRFRPWIPAPRFRGDKLRGNDEMRLPSFPAAPVCRPAPLDAAAVPVQLSAWGHCRLRAPGCASKWVCCRPAPLDGGRPLVRLAAFSVVWGSLGGEGRSRAVPDG